MAKELKSRNLNRIPIKLVTMKQAVEKQNKQMKGELQPWENNPAKPRNKSDTGNLSGEGRGRGEKEAGAVREQPHEPKVQIRRNQSLQQRRGIEARDYKQRRRSLSEQNGGLAEEIRTLKLLSSVEE
ncbi:predicted protein [Arabidopsis lyrata subsp. lyrata]|uniref:Predicted protein n=1 Tax=Arabidopsis lyrata subsp. lyrata TaxID=81972 RepID=D7MQR7_ARALL|nr:predicted protein [Arabidopsis lyrata subsp. lyrata]